MARENKSSQDTLQTITSGTPSTTGNDGVGASQTESVGPIKPIGLYSHKRGIFQLPRILGILHRQLK